MGNRWVYQKERFRTDFFTFDILFAWTIFITFIYAVSPTFFPFDFASPLSRCFFDMGIVDTGLVIT
jgi:hypothetical protein